MRVRVDASVDVPLPPEQAFAAVIDVPGQDRWIIATSLYPVHGPVLAPQVGSRLAAFTGVASIGFLDIMTVTAYEPPHRWVTEHQGSFVRGVGIFEVVPAGEGSTVTWAEEVDLPLGIVGRIAWVVIAPVVRLALGASLRRLAKLIGAGTLPSTPAPPALR